MRKRRDVDSFDDDKGSHQMNFNIKRRKRSYMSTLFLTCVCVSSTLLACALLPDFVPYGVHHFSANVIDKLTSGTRQKYYAVVLDGGSTGTRVLAFTFHYDLLYGKLRLDDELWAEDKPGLSSNAANPDKAAASVSILLSRARERIPKESWKNVPVVLKATAGLRLLPVEQSEAIIKHVGSVLRDSGFKVKGEAVGIMDPLEEGLFAWFAINFLLDSLDKPISETYAALDLGGGSTQITFGPTAASTLTSAPKHMLHDVTIFKKPEKVYSHSYLGLGLMTVRQGVFGRRLEQDRDLRTPCVNSREPVAWSFHSKDYRIMSENPSYENCLVDVLAYVREKNVNVPDELISKKIAVFSYFYDRASEHGLVEGFGGETTILDFQNAAKIACSRLGGDSFHCLDLTYMTALLHHGYGLPLDKELSVYKKINNHETSWALGAAFNILESEDLK